MEKINRKLKGFTLIEMAIVLFIISLLILIVLPNIGMQRKHADSINGKALQTQLNTQAQLYMDEKNVTSVSIEQLASENYLSEDQAQQIRKKKLEIQVDGEQ